MSTESPEFQTFNAQFEAAHNMKATVYAYYALDALYMIEYGIEESIAKTQKVDPTRFGTLWRT